MRKLVNINGQSAKASIRTSSCVNLINIKYIEKRGLTWRRLNDETTIGETSDEVVGYVSGIEIVVNDVSVVEKFYVIRELPYDILLGMPWIVKVQCGFAWKDGKYYCTIESGRKATFRISEDFTIGDDINEDYVINKESMMKNDDQREDEFMDVRCVKSELIGNGDDGVSCTKKKKRIVSMMNKKVTNQMKDLNFKNILMDESCDEVSCHDKHCVYDCKSVIEAEKDEKNIVSGGSSSDCRAETDNKVVNDNGRVLNSNCCGLLVKQ
ncbi:14988_t:CDS:1 [Dentiscutata erythropus]|uniref:14988_t:CDS:1 n=1 Tax=Dentiscutata erythropus TaxID=1348616 RepID=A0A9N9AWD5_9GLOM|nr:14988_t:CDS:1 [Dentiscutata erythropus]